jgi:hypothetical protein
MGPGRTLFLRRQRNLGDQAKRALRNWRETAGAKGMSAVLIAVFSASWSAVKVRV